MCGAILSFPNTPSRCGARLKHRDFTFTVGTVFVHLFAHHTKVKITGNVTDHQYTVATGAIKCYCYPSYNSFYNFSSL